MTVELASLSTFTTSSHQGTKTLGICESVSPEKKYIYSGFFFEITLILKDTFLEPQKTPKTKMLLYPIITVLP